MGRSVAEYRSAIIAQMTRSTGRAPEAPPNYAHNPTRRSEDIRKKYGYTARNSELRDEMTPSTAQLLARPRSPSWLMLLN